MAALDFPTATTDGQIFKADNGVWYTWVAAGSYWSGSLGTAIGNLEGYYVNKTGDKMFGNLTLGTEDTTSIVLNATSGAATFDGRLTLNGTGAGTAAYIGNNGEVQITYQGNITTAGSITAGEADFGGRVNINGSVNATAGDIGDNAIQLKSNGEIIAVGNIRTGDFNATSSSSNGIAATANGLLYIQRSINSRAISIYQNATENFGINTDGTVRLGGVLPASPKIELNADGSADFAGGYGSNGGVTIESNGKAYFNKQVTINQGSENDIAIQIETLGTAKLAINSAGSITAASDVNTTGKFVSDRTSSSFALWQGKVAGTKTSEILADGSADFAGNVGIGATSPEYKLHAIEPTNDAVALFDSNNINGAHIRFGKSGVLKHFIGGASGFGAGDSDDLGYRAYDQHIWLTSSSERMRIDSSGRLLVGTSSTSNNVMAVFQANSASSTGAGVVNIARGQTFTEGGTNIGNLEFTDSDGNVFSQINASSDGAVTAGSSHPGRLVFSTTPEGSATGSERLRLQSNGIAIFKSGPCAIQQSVKTFIGDNTFKNITRWDNQGDQTGGGSILVMLHNHTGTSGGYVSLHMIHINFDGTLGSSIPVAKNGISFDADVNQGVLRFKAFDGTTGLTTSMGFSLIYSDARAHTTA